MPPEQPAENNHPHSAQPDAFSATLRRERVITVIRQATAETIVAELQALYDGGLRLFEITVEAPGAVAALERARTHVPADALLGAGTVLEGGTAAAAIAAGAQFLVSPVLARGVAQVARAHGIPCMLGGMTPTEIHRAYQWGCPAVKVFPASTLGPRFMRELRGPLGHIPLVPTGGITLENAHTYLEAGATAIGVGSALLKHEWVRAAEWDALREAARSWAAFKTPTPTASV